MSRVLAIGDIHEPVSHPAYLDFCKDLYQDWACDKVVFMGDLADWHALSFWDKEPACPSPFDEYKQIKKKIQKWYKCFPNAKLCIGNHDERPDRIAKKGGLPTKVFMRDYNEIWGTPKWEWGYDFIVDGVYYLHGTGKGGINPAWNVKKEMGMSVVMGHTHARGGVKWSASPLATTFALDTGCGIDSKALQFIYGRHCKTRPILGAGIILDGKHAYFERMPIAPGEKYSNNKSKYKKRKFKFRTK
jgi:predicted phosphodiesterase